MGTTIVSFDYSYPLVSPLSLSSLCGLLTYSCLWPEYDEKSRDIFGENYPRLQKLKAQFDPGNVFNKLFAVTPQA